MFALTT